MSFYLIYRNSYSSFSVRFIAENAVVAPLTRPASTQCGLVFSFFSMMYSLIGAPPSFLGGCHWISIRLLSQSTTFGFPGASGSSANIQNNELWIWSKTVLYQKHSSRRSPDLTRAVSIRPVDWLLWLWICTPCLAAAWLFCHDSRKIDQP